VVLFESPLRVVTLLRDVLVELGDRRSAVARELTKIHEEVMRGRVSEILAMLLDSEPRGEIVVVLEGAETPEAALSEMVDEARRLVRDGMRKREAAGAVAGLSGGSANEIYRALLGSEVEPEVEPEVEMD
jgi:16S rRNA (cytidine1402-2'-O)-methyltransferase